MNIFYVINGKKFRKYFILSAAVIFAAGIIYTEKDNVSVFAPNQPAAVYSVQTNKKVLALTFDISWGEKRPGPIIKILEDKGVKNATFFLSGPWSKTHPDIVAEIKKGGFEIGSHGNKHVNYSKLSDDQIRQQIQIAHLVLTGLTGVAPTLIRMPNGDFNKRVLQIAAEENYTVIQWDTDSLDWLNKGVHNIINRVVSKAHPGDIILMHASDTVTQTQDALPAIIDQLRAKGYQFETVSQLMKETTVSPQPVY